MSYENDDDNEYPTNYAGYWNKEAAKPLQNVCMHDWVKYTGFTEVYFFCEKCDEKSEKEPFWWKKT